MPEFVIRIHNAERAGLHTDLHLQSDERVYKSWVLKKGMPTTKGVKHLAVATYDHTSEDARTNGRIAEGYGKGTTEVVDEGEFIPKRWTNSFIEARLIGSTFNGTWYMRRIGDKQWLCWKAS